MSLESCATLGSVDTINTSGVKLSDVSSKGMKEGTQVWVHEKSSFYVLQIGNSYTIDHDVYETALGLPGGQWAKVVSGGGVTLLVAGTNIASLDNIITGLLIANSPADVIIGTGTNDIFAGTTPTAFETSLNSVLAKIAAWNSGRTRVWIREIFFRGEAWNTGPVWNNGAVDAAIDAINAKMVACAAAAGATFIPLRAAILTQEVISNPSKLSSSIFSGDGIHPNDPGRVEMSTLALPTFTVSE
jgi:lysophospholipase L1-like esterase